MDNKSEDVKLNNVSDESNCGYAGVVNTFKWIRIVFLIVLLAIVIFSYIIHASDLSYKNIRMFLEDIKTSMGNTANENAGIITYTAGDSASFFPYKNGLAIVNMSEVSAYSSTGRHIISVPISMTNPTTQTVGDYLLVYDRNGHSYSFFHSYSCTSSTTDTEYPIVLGCVSEKGLFGIVTKSTDATSNLVIYNTIGKKVCLYKTNDYIVDVGFTHEKDTAYLLCLNAKNGEWITKLVQLRISSGESVREQSIENCLSLQMFLTTNAIWLQTDKSLIQYNYKLDRVAVYELDFQHQTFIESNGDSIAVLVQYNDSSLLSVYGDKGKDTISIPQNDVYIDMKYKNGYVFLLGEKQVSRISTKKENVTSIDCSTIEQHFVVHGDNDIMLCSATRAAYYTFN